MELKNVLNFPNSGTSQPSTKTRKILALKHVKKSMNLSVTTGQPPHHWRLEAAALRFLRANPHQLSHVGGYSFMPQTTPDFGDEALRVLNGMDFETWASVELFLLWWCFGRSGWCLERLGQLHCYFCHSQAKIKKLTTWELMERPYDQLGWSLHTDHKTSIPCGQATLKWRFWSGCRSLQE